MPGQPPTTCSRDGCLELASGGRCEACRVQYGAEERTTPWRAAEIKWRNSARWRGKHGRRAGQLRREPLCRVCAEGGRITIATEVDHIVPTQGDYKRFWYGELQSLCRSDHSAKTAKEVVRD